MEGVAGVVQVEQCDVGANNTGGYNPPYVLNTSKVLGSLVELDGKATLEQMALAARQATGEAEVTDWGSHARPAPMSAERERELRALAP